MSFRQIKLVFKREYMTKIRSKGFIAATILIPVGMLVFVGIVVGITILGMNSEFTIAVADHSGQLYSNLHEMNNERYLDAHDTPADSLQAMVKAGEINGYIFLDKGLISGNKSPELIYDGSGGISLLNSVENDIGNAIRSARLKQAHVSAEVQQIYDSTVNLRTVKLTEKGKVSDDNMGILTGIGAFMGIIIFIALSGYGGMLARSVIQEKTNRIVEVIASSVKPIELLIGKMSGIAALGITQIAVWIITAIGIFSAAVPIAGMFIDNSAEVMQEAANNPAADASPDLSILQMPHIDPMIFVWFFIFFLLGYLLYSTFFAALGSAVDSETDTQQFMFPIMVPIMLAYFIMFQAIRNPDSSLSVISSFIPFFSPIIMITRIVITDVPLWQIGTSIFFLVITFAGGMWLCAKIYQVGILSYGQTASFKELAKWIRE